LVENRFEPGTWILDDSSLEDEKRVIHVHKAVHRWDWTAEGDSFAGICIDEANGGSEVPFSPWR
jgi:hypothetical protein